MVVVAYLNNSSDYYTGAKSSLLLAVEKGRGSHIANVSLKNYQKKEKKRAAL